MYWKPDGQNVLNNDFFSCGSDCEANKGSKGIRRWPIGWCTSSMIIHKISPSID